MRFSSTRRKSAWRRRGRTEGARAFIAFLESYLLDDAEKNAFVPPIRVSDSVEDYIAALATDLGNRSACGRDAAVRAWIAASRTDGFGKVVRAVDPTDTAKLAILARLREATASAARNLPRLLAALS
jgi:hypothetical protein